MWTAERQALRDDVVRILIKEGHVNLSVSRVAELWRDKDDAFRWFFVDVLKSARFRCFRLETPAVTKTSAHNQFEFVLVDSPEIDLAPDPRAFDEHFEGQSGEILVFENLGRDATMVVPRPCQGIPGYPHIAAFLQHAPVAQQMLLWQSVGRVLHRLMGDKPIWLNTAGGGVPWLHVRLDSRPKYYVFDEYRVLRDRSE